MSLDAPPSKRAKLDEYVATLAVEQQGNCSRNEVRGVMCVRVALVKKRAVGKDRGLI